MTQVVQEFVTSIQTPFQNDALNTHAVPGRTIDSEEQLRFLLLQNIVDVVCATQVDSEYQKAYACIGEDGVAQQRDIHRAA